MKSIFLATLLILASVEICTSSGGDECLPQSWYKDEDKDGYGNPLEKTEACEPPTDFVANADDPDDQNDQIYPGAPEINPISCTSFVNFDGNVILVTQKDVVDFGAKCVGKIKGNLKIGDWSGLSEDPIIDLSPLKSVTEIDGQLVLVQNSELTSLEGLHSLEKISQYLGIYLNSKLTDLNGLRNLNHVEYEIEITENASLTSLHGLEKLKSANRNLIINNNKKLQSLKGLNGLENAAFIGISNNPQLSNFQELTSIQKIEGIAIISNQNLTSLFNSSSLPSGLVNIIVTENSKLVNLNGLMNSNSSLSGGIEISKNQNLESIEGVYPYLELLSDLKITDNPKLKDLIPLSPIVKVQRDLWINNNDQLKSLNGLENLRLAGRVYNPPLPGSINRSLDILGNDLLTDFCALQGLFNDGYAPLVNILTNKYNPSIEDIKQGRCSE